jgi:hypothetical protein
MTGIDTQRQFTRLDAIAPAAVACPRQIMTAHGQLTLPAND